MHLLWDVLIPAFNAADHIEMTLESALTQGRQPERVIVCDDASADATVEKVLNQSSTQLIRNAVNLGVGSTRQRLLEAANSEWILFLDADDQLLPWASEVFAAAIDVHPDAAVLAFGQVQMGKPEDHQRFLGVFDSPALVTHAQLLKGNPICSSAALIRRDVVLAAGGFTSARRLIDYCLWLRIARNQAYPIFVYRTPVVRRLISAKTITGNVTAAVTEEARLLNREWEFSNSPGLKSHLLKQVRLAELWLRGLSRHIDYGKPSNTYVKPTELEGYSKALGFLGALRTPAGSLSYAAARSSRGYLRTIGSRMNQGLGS